MNDRAVVPAAAGGQIAHEQELGAEHARLARYVAGVEATPYQISKYVDFHQRREVEPLNEFDAFLLRLSSWGRPGLALCDAYTGTLYRSSIVRVKLMITVAILECSPPSFVELDKPESNERWVFVSMFLRIALSAIALFVALLVIAPFHLLYAATGRARKKRGSVVAPLT